MKKPQHLLSLLAGAALLAASNLSAATTDPVGYVSKDVPTGASLLSAPFVESPQYTGVSGTVEGDTVTLDNLPSSLESPSYLQLLDGSGGFSTILSHDSSSVTLESVPENLAEGVSVKIVKHFTSGDILDAAQASIPDNSSLTIYNSDGSIDSYTALSGDWYPDGEFDQSNDVIIFPGEGFVLNLQSAVSFTFSGTVNTEPFTLPLTNGAVNIVSSLDPSTETGEDSIGSLLSNLGDNSSITIYTDDGNLDVVETYTLLSGDWYAEGSFDPAEVTIASPATIVVNPQATSTVTLPEAY